MIAYNSTGKEVVNILEQDLKSLTAAQGDKILREIAQALTSVMIIRVHQEGKAADGSKIGTYSPEYMKVRTGQYGNSETYKKGKKKGQTKNAGVYTKGKNIGKQRKKYNRTSSTDVILSLTRQMEIDLSTCEQNPAEIPNGYAIGYQNDLNYDKAIWNEQRYNKKILTKLSKEEEALALQILQNRINDIFATTPLRFIANMISILAIMFLTLGFIKRYYAHRI